MTSNNYISPYLRKTRFQYKYPSLSSSCSSLYVPSISSCPRKKYSTNNWYDMKSSNPELSQKIIYRMNAEYYKRQYQRSSQSDQFEKHIDGCLLGHQFKKNPFSKTRLVEQIYPFNRKQNEKQPGYHWTDQKSNRNCFIQPQHYRSQTEILQQYNKIRTKQNQPVSYNYKITTSTPSFPQKFGLKDTFGNVQQNKFISEYQRNRVVQSLFPKQKTAQQKYQYKPKQKQIQHKVYQRPKQQNQKNQLKITLKPVQSQKQLSKKQSNETFGYRNSYQELPNKIIYDNVQYFQIRL